MTGNDCRMRAEEARQQATRADQNDKDTWLLIAEKYDRLAGELDWLDTRALQKQSVPQLAAAMNIEPIS